MSHSEAPLSKDYADLPLLPLLTDAADLFPLGLSIATLALAIIMYASRCLPILPFESLYLARPCLISADPFLLYGFDRFYGNL